MAGATMTFAYDEVGPIHRVVVTWLSDDSTGAVTGTTKKIVGTLLKGFTDPGAAAPTASYDIVLKQDVTGGINLLAQCIDDLIDRHTTSNEEVYFNLISGTQELASYPVVCDKIFVDIANAGNAKNGVLTIYFRPH